MIHVIAIIDLNPGTRDAFVGEMKKIVPLVKAENGCLEYGPQLILQAGPQINLPWVKTLLLLLKSGRI